MVGTKSRGYSNSGRLSEGEYSMPFFSTRPSPSFDIIFFFLQIFDMLFSMNFTSAATFALLKLPYIGHTLEHMQYILQ